MKKSYKSLFLVLSLAVLINACDGQGDSLINERLEDNPLSQTPEYTAGSADFSTYIAIGNSLTAGYADGALYTAAQQMSFPAMLATQFSAAVEGDITFNQPDINSEKGFNTVVENPQNGQILGRFKLDTSIPGPSPTIGGEAPTAYSGPQVHNFGVPGIQVGQLLTPATGGPDSPANPAFNPFYQRFASSPSQDGATGSTIIGDAVATQPTFFSLWIGNNDVLGYAASGGANEAIFTSAADFDTRFNATVNTLIANTQAHGVVSNIPFILGLPVFQAVRWNNITLDATTAGAINQGVQSVNGAIQACANAPLNAITAEDAARRLISYSAGDNPILAIDEELDDLGPCFDNLQTFGQINAQQRAALVPYEQSRPMVAGELVLLSAGSVLGTPFNGNADQAIGVVIPLGFNADGSLSGDQFYLTLAEQQAIEVRRAQFNGTIAAAVAANSSRLALHDTNSPTGVFYDIFGLSDGVPGITVQGVNLAPDFSPNGILSTDGVHPNPRGYAIIANEMLGVIEAKWGAMLPRINVINLPSVVVCGVGDCVSEL
jgi:lysophospholipase L1-like esterase